MVTAVELGTIATIEHPTTTLRLKVKTFNVALLTNNGSELSEDNIAETFELTMRLYMPRFVGLMGVMARTPFC